MTERKIDFHIHYNPEIDSTAYEAIDRARERGIVAMALMGKQLVSPHFNDFQEYGKEIGVDVFSGMELVTQDGNIGMNIIAIGFDPLAPSIEKWRSDLENKDIMAQRYKAQYEYLLNSGYIFPETEEANNILSTLLDGSNDQGAIEYCRMISDYLPNHQHIEVDKLSEPETWKETVEKYSDIPEYSHMLEAKFLYKKHFAFGKPGNFIRFTDTNEAINRIHSAGGVALYSPEGSFEQEKWDRLIELQIDGIMAWHGGKLGMSGHSKDVPLSVLKNALRSDLLILGGSDYQAKDWQAGVGNGEMFISSRRLGDLRKYQKQMDRRIFNNT